MKRLWTPWRMAYLKPAQGTKKRGCIFCAKIRETNTTGTRKNAKDRENLVVWRGERAFVVMNLYPYTNGHLMVAPYQHTGNLEDLDGETLQEMMLLVGTAIRALRALMQPQGFNVGINLGKVAGAGVTDHVHIHVVPRWGGDTNFMPILAEVRMIPELLPQTYDRLLKAFRAVTAAPHQPRRKKKA